MNTGASIFGLVLNSAALLTSVVWARAVLTEIKRKRRIILFDNLRETRLFMLKQDIVADKIELAVVLLLYVLALSGLCGQLYNFV